MPHRDQFFSFLVQKRFQSILNPVGSQWETHLWDFFKHIKFFGRPSKFFIFGHTILSKTSHRNLPEYFRHISPSSFSEKMRPFMNYQQTSNMQTFCITYLGAVEKRDGQIRPPLHFKWHMYDHFVRCEIAATQLSILR